MFEGVREVFDERSEFAVPGVTLEVTPEWYTRRGYLGLISFREKLAGLCARENVSVNALA